MYYSGQVLVYDESPAITKYCLTRVVLSRWRPCYPNALLGWDITGRNWGDKLSTMPACLGYDGMVGDPDSAQ